MPGSRNPQAELGLPRDGLRRRRWWPVRSGVRLKIAVAVLAPMSAIYLTLMVMLVRHGIDYGHVEMLAPLFLTGALVLPLGLGLAILAHRWMMDPLRDLRAVAERITREHDFTLRAALCDDPELAEVTSAFNDLLDQVLVAQHELARVNEQLEQNVEARTSDLSRTVEHLVGEVHRREQLEAAARLSETVLRRFLEAAPDAMLRVDQDDRIVTVNAATGRAFGWHSAELLGADVRVLLPGWPAAMARADAAPEANAIVESIGRHATDKSIPVEISVRRLDACESGWCLTIRDITERRLAQAARQRQRNLQEAVRSLEQVLGVIGHELRTPLATLRLTSELLASGVEEERDQMIQEMHEETVRMCGMVNNILEAASLVRGLARWNWGDVNVSDVVSDAVESIRPQVSSAAVQLEHSVSPAGLTMRGDGPALGRLLVNLLTNAAKHTTAGRIRINIEGDDRPEKRWVVMRVSDTGSGIAGPLLENLGEPFRLNRGLRGAGYVSGLGLGLAICRGIVAAHGGTMQVESKVGEGTAVTVRLRADLDRAEVQHVEDLKDAEVQS